MKKTLIILGLLTLLVLSALYDIVAVVVTGVGAFMVLAAIIFLLSVKFEEKDFLDTENGQK